MNEKENQWVLDNVDSINADVNDIDELCCALEHSTIFAVDYIQTFATELIDFELKYKTLQQELDQYKNILEDIDKYIHNFKIENIGEKTMLILNDILLIKNGLGKDVIRLNKMKELEENK